MVMGARRGNQSILNSRKLALVVSALMVTSGARSVYAQQTAQAQTAQPANV
jgi:hypothetical protein